jgi:urease accessory protein UreH
MKIGQRDKNLHETRNHSHGEEVLICNLITKEDRLKETKEDEGVTQEDDSGLQVMPVGTALTKALFESEADLRCKSLQRTRNLRNRMKREHLRSKTQ